MAIALVVVSLGGCLSQVLEEDSSGCSFYPDREYLDHTWKPLANLSDEGYDGVSFLVEPWRENIHDWHPDDVHSIDWQEYPSGQRPQLVDDLLCHSRGRTLSGEGREDGSMGFVGTSLGEAQQAMDAMRKETSRQNGGEEQDPCCIVYFSDIYYAVGYRVDSEWLAHALWGTEGNVEMSVYHDETPIRHSGSKPHPFHVSRKARMVHVEAIWDEGVYSLDLLVRRPDAEHGEWDHRAEGGSFDDTQNAVNLTIHRDDLDNWEGDWGVVMVASDIAKDVDYVIAITVFTWEWELPDGYSRLS